MNGEQNKNSEKENPTDKFVEGEDYYFDKGLMVLTERFLKNRGYCCESGCRHCPYRDEAETDQSR